MKYSALRNRLTALEARLSLKPTKVIITGGLPPDFEPAQPAPPGRELKAQAAAFRRHLRQAPAESAGESAAAEPSQAAPAADDSPPASVAAPAGRIDQGLAPLA